MSERRRYDRNNQRNSDSGGDKLDIPKNSRLFVVASKDHTNEILRDHFAQFAGFEDVWLVTDRRTNESKGVAYVKFNKASQAARAMENTDGTVIGDVGRSVKVKVAQSRQSGSTRDFDEEEELTRIFIVVPKTYKDSDIRDKFGEYGTITKVHQLLDKITGEKKGFAYVKYCKMFEAATAIESCNPDFKAVWAEPRMDKLKNREMEHWQRESSWDRGGQERGRGYEPGYDRGRPEPRRREMHYYEDSFEGSEAYRASGRDDYYYQATAPTPASVPSLGGGYEDVTGYIQSTTNLPANATSRLQVELTGKATETQLHALFNIVPGLEYCDFREENGAWGAGGTAHVRYKSTVFAAYARSKMNGLQYPEQHPMMIQFMGAPGSGPKPHASSALMSPPSMPVFSSPTYGRSEESYGYVKMEHPSHHVSCSVKLPPPQMLAPIDSEVKERLFIILTRQLPERLIQDTFARFGQLVDYHTIKGRNYGFAKYADAECARRAMDTLHGQELNGERLKVVIAEPEKVPSNKRARVD